jgi:branched-chain amino acid transport system ATP-binding protein
MAGRGGARGYHDGSVDTVVSVEEVAREAGDLADRRPDASRLEALAGGEPQVAIEGLVAGYGRMEILHGVDLRVGRGQSLCLIGPNGAGKSTVLHAIYGFAAVFAGRVAVGGVDVTRLSPNQKLRDAGIAYILQDNSVFPDMTVEENLWMGGYLKDRPADARAAAEKVFDRYGRLAERRNDRALVMEPSVLLVDEPSIGLEPRYIDMVFSILEDLRDSEGKTIIMVEQNARKGLEFADIGYVLVNGEVAMAGTGDELLADPQVGRLFLGG